MRYPDGKYFDDAKVISDLNGPLQLELREHACAKVLENLHVQPGSPMSHFLAENLMYRTFVTGARVLRQGRLP